MAESRPTITTAEVKAYLEKRQGKEITLADVRKDLNILPGTKSFDAISNILWQLDNRTDGIKIVRSVGKKAGVYKVIKQVEPVSVFSVVRER